MTEAAGNINKGFFAFVIDHARAYRSLQLDFQPEEACRIREIEIVNARQKQGTFALKGFPYKRIIDYQ